MKTKGRREKFSNVWDALESTHRESANMTMRSDLLIAIRRRVATWKVTQAGAARRLQVTRPRLNDLLLVRVDKFCLDTLVNLADRAAISVGLRIDMAA